MGEMRLAFALLAACLVFYFRCVHSGGVSYSALCYSFMLRGVAFSVLSIIEAQS